MIITECFHLDPNNCVLDPTGIDIWQFSLNETLAQSATILNADELSRAARFYFERHQRRFATARTRVREILGAYLGLPAATLEFTYNQYGKPEVINSQQLQFNVSHSGEIALLAIGKTFPLGVDLEQYSARPYIGIAKQLFSPTEQTLLKNSPSRLKPALFFHIWAQKEAFIKACGLGLSYPTETFTVPIHNTSNFRHTPSKNLENPQFYARYSNKCSTLL
jgi:4'-phosphopantetheinyl transferase